jgi:cell division control protein 12
MASSLKPLDIEIMKRLGTRVNLIPVVAKADTLTQDGLFDFKERVSLLNSCILCTSSIYTTPLQIRQVINAQNIRIYKPPLESDDEASDHARLLIDAMPFSIIGSTDDVKTADGRIVKGREYLWGVAEGLSGIFDNICRNAKTSCS